MTTFTNDFKTWLLKLKSDRISSEVRTVRTGDMLYMYLNYAYPPHTTDLLFGDSVQIEDGSIVGLVIDDKDTVNRLDLLNRLDTVIVSSYDKARDVQEQVPYVTVVIDSEYKYLNNSDNDSRITDVLLEYEYEQISDNVYTLI